MSRILLTGATGFIGRHLLPALCEGAEVVALTRRAPAAGGPAGVTWVEQDLARSLDSAKLPERIDAVVHLAQSKHYRAFPEQAADIYRVNVQSTFELADYARRAGAGQFVLASSGGVYGTGSQAFREDDPLEPANFYLNSKAVAEMLVAAYKSFFLTKVLRFFFVYGRDQRAMLVPAMLGKVQAGEKIVVDGDPGLHINPIHVDDAVRAIRAALDLTTSEVINVAGPEVVTITDLVRCCEQALGKRAEVEHRGDRPSPWLVGDIDRMRRVLDVEPAVRLADGVRDMAEPGPGDA